MKNLFYFFLVLGFLSCDKKSSYMATKPTNTSSKTAHHLNSQFVNIKSNLLTDKKRDLVITKKFFRENNSLIIDYSYPYLDEKQVPLSKNFNLFIEEQYLKTDAPISEIILKEDISCDLLYKDAKRRKRNADYKVYTENDNFLSLLIYKTNHYDSEKHNSYMFKSLNYDLQQGRFLTYKDFFTSESDTFLLFKLNQELQARIQGQDSFQPCWKFTKDTFDATKNNFVVTSEYIRFYFDDCVVCPSYTGNHYLEIPIEELQSILDMNLFGEKNNSIPIQKING